MQNISWNHKGDSSRRPEGGRVCVRTCVCVSVCVYVDGSMENTAIRLKRLSEYVGFVNGGRGLMLV